MIKTLLEVNDLRTSFFTQAGEVKAVDGVSFTVGEGEVVALVGESGCGKSVTSLSVMGLISDPGRIMGGAIRFQGENLLAKSERQWQKIRGANMAMIFQDPMTSLNPVLDIGKQVTEVLRLHMGMDSAGAPDTGGGTAEPGRHSRRRKRLEATRTSFPAACGSV